MRNFFSSGGTAATSDDHHDGGHRQRDRQVTRGPHAQCQARTTAAAASEADQHAVDSSLANTAGTSRNRT